ncbi:MAG TPA: type III-B CRISPR module RAMP protein Cmr6 [Candidatus Acidoferrales bacterium]|nr:type III-B CRISPR module RAMP protein Cmr6 [Candidatus Acidoferrales bacterium]
MPVAAVPAYLGKHFEQASPALRFGMYLELWGVNRRTHALLWETHDLDYEVRGQDRREREVKYENKVLALSAAKRLNDTEKKTMLALLERQESTFKTIASAGSLRLEAQAISPFTTGLGNEHPLENGFVFLNPYGLPYLPGSGVKGVLRQAATELASGAWGDRQGWSSDTLYRINVGTQKDPRWLGLSMLDVLFGRETPSGESDHVRGALTFWDVIPQIKGESLLVEIMTPHQSHYYQQKRQAGSTHPHDSGQPTPICFLTVPPSSGFTFYVVCDVDRLRRLTGHEMSEGAPDLLAEGETHWKTVLEAAFRHAFQWLGFGAKTAVGYGAMSFAPTPAVSAPVADMQRTITDQLSGPTQAMVSGVREETWKNVTITWEPGPRVAIARAPGQRPAEARGKAADEFLSTLTDQQSVPPPIFWTPSHVILEIMANYP